MLFHCNKLYHKVPGNIMSIFSTILKGTTSIENAILL